MGCPKELGGQPTGCRHGTEASGPRDRLVSDRTSAQIGTAGVRAYCVVGVERFRGTTLGPTCQTNRNWRKMLEQKNIHPLAALMGAAVLLMAAPALAQPAPATPAADPAALGARPS